MISDLIALRVAGKAIVSQAVLHGRLARVEWAEEKNRLLKMFIIVLPGFACLLCVMIFSGVLALFIGWSTGYLIPALILMIVIYGAGAGFAWQRFQGLFAQGNQSFAATREEVTTDISLLRNLL